MRCRIQIDLKPNELEMIECIARANSKRASDFAKEALLETVMNRTIANGEEKRNPLTDMIAARLSKLERIQRSILINTAISRGYVIAMRDTSDVTVGKQITSNIDETVDGQREIFFALYPEQKDSKQ